MTAFSQAPLVIAFALRKETEYVAPISFRVNLKYIL
jgi:hypothetical protein